MLTELAAINAAFAIVKETVAHGRDLVSAGSAINDFVNAKEQLESKHRKQKQSVFGDDFQTFLAIEEVKQKENELREYMMLYGRANLWYDWVRFQAQARKERQRAIEARRKKREQLIETIGIVSMFIVFCILFIAIIYVVVKKWP